MREVIALTKFRLSKMLKQLHVTVCPAPVSAELDLAKTSEQPFGPPSLIRLNFLFLRGGGGSMNNENKGHGKQRRFTNAIYIYGTATESLNHSLPRHYRKN